MVPAPVSEAGDRSGGVGDRVFGHGEDRAARADRDHGVARSGIESERAPGVVPQTRADHRARGGDAHPLGRSEHLGEARDATERPREQIEIVGTGRGAPVRSAAGIGAVRRERLQVGAEVAGAGRPEAAQPPGEPVVGQGDGSDPGRIGRLVLAQPPQLRARERRHGHDSDPARVFLGTDFGHERRRGLGAADVVPEQGVTHHAPLHVERHEPVLLGGDRDRGDVVQSAGIDDRALECRPPGLGVHLRAGRMRRPAGAHDLSRLQVVHTHLAALRGRIHPGDVCRHPLLPHP